jgi:hypothetical protein
MKTYGKGWRYNSTFLDLGTRLEVNGQLHASAALPPEKNSPAGIRNYPFNST